MKPILILFFICFSSFLNCTQKQNSNETTISNKTTTYYFIRHAEKDRTDPSNKNPHLTETGKTRAVKWSNILQHVPFDAVYSTDYYRTKETSEPTATKNELEINIYDENKLDVASFLNDTKGKTVLIVGHSNTIPQFVNSVLDIEKYEDIDDDNNGNLYMITIIDGKKSDQVLTIN
jgi:broad specificity phosphatase PhoE